MVKGAIDSLWDRVLLKGGLSKADSLAVSISVSSGNWSGDCSFCIAAELHRLPYSVCHTLFLQVADQYKGDDHLESV